MEERYGKGGGDGPPHIIAIPFIGQGHLSPLAHLCTLLSSRHGFLVTLVTLDIGHGCSPPSTDGNPHLRLASLAVPGIDGLCLDQPGAFPAVFAAIEQLGDQLRCLVRRLIEKKDSVVCAIISDALCSSWTQEVADEFSIPRIALITSSLSMGLYATHLPSLLALDSGNVCGHGGDLVLPGLPCLHPRDIPTFFHIHDETYSTNQYYARQFIHLNKAKHVLANTFEELEGKAMEVMVSKQVPICIVGPLNLINTKTSVSVKTLSFWEEKEECITWLNEKPSSSVVYISFGSITKLSIVQIHEIIYGLEATQIPFLFVLRSGMVDTPATSYSSFLQGLRERCIKNHGLVTSWAPQLYVLSHPSIAAFLTHCGWNSVLESISYGVPMICWPYFADQILNRKLVVEEWGIGMECSLDEDGLVRRGEIETILKKIMQSEEGKELKKRALKLKDTATMACAVETSPSFKNILDLVEVLKT